jgi:hypothetical protein
MWREEEEGGRRKRTSEVYPSYVLPNSKVPKKDG